MNSLHADLAATNSQSIISPPNAALKNDQSVATRSNHLRESVPVGFIERTSDDQQILYIFDSLQPELRTLPPGVVAIEIVQAVAKTRPANPGSYPTTFRTDQLVNRFQFVAEQRDLNAFYLIRWVLENGKTGGWSDLVFSGIGNLNQDAGGND